MALAPSTWCALAVVALAGCGGGGHERRDAVNSYFDRVQRAQAPLRNQRGPIELAFRRFSIDRNPPTEVKALAHARKVVDGVRGDVRAIEPPPEARQVHADLVRMLDLEASVANELLWTARYLPQARAAMSPLGPAGAA